jgi:hypothetical protein
MKSDVQIMRNFARKLASVSPELDALNKPIDQLPAPGAKKTAPAAAKKPGMLESLRGAMPDMSNIDYGSVAGGIGGGIGAGLGARGLANLFRSKEDEEEGKTPWWANAAGLGAGVGGAVLGANYLPQLISMLTGQPKQTGSGYGPGDMHIEAPEAGNAQLQTTRPMNAAAHA